jgi:septum formation protein
MKIILASKSPRRKEILENLGIKFEITVSDVDESSDEKDPARLVKELSLRKGRAVAEKIINEKIYGSEEVYIISSDTVVAAPSGEILGKPTDIEDAGRMLSMLEGKAHFVHSGIAIIKISKDGSVTEAADTESTSVEFLPMTRDEIDFYVKNENVLDKAGAYAIQGIASAWIKKIDGDYFNVVGLPTCRMISLFGEAFGIGRKDIICKI